MRDSHEWPIPNYLTLNPARVHSQRNLRLENVRIVALIVQYIQSFASTRRELARTIMTVRDAHPRPAEEQRYHMFEWLCSAPAMVVGPPGSSKDKRCLGPSRGRWSNFFESPRSFFILSLQRRKSQQNRRSLR